MIQNIVTSIILYSGTAVDLLIILMLFFAKRKSRKDIINIYLGQFLGSVSLILLSLLFAFVLNYIPSKEILGLLGLIPIFLGLKVLLLGDSDGEAIAKDGLRKDNKNLIFLVAMITFASCGADNIGVFVPYFITLNLANLIVALLTLPNAPPVVLLLTTTLPVASYFFCVDAIFTTRGVFTISI